VETALKDEDIALRDMGTALKDGERAVKNMEIELKDAMRIMLMKIMKIMPLLKLIKIKHMIKKIVKSGTILISIMLIMQMTLIKTHGLP
jgi:hypothetical protein